MLMLTKRPQLINKLCPLRSQRIWHGVTAETQAWLDLRWPILRDVDSEVYWLSVEPMMGAMTLPQSFLDLGQRAWCIVGGESGPRARPMHPEWARAIVNQCQNASVPVFVKQILERGRRVPMEQWPEDLRVREFPLVHTWTSGVQSPDGQEAASSQKSMEGLW